MTTSHYDGELTGLARHPSRAEFATAGGDGTVGHAVIPPPVGSSTSQPVDKRGRLDLRPGNDRTGDSDGSYRGCNDGPDADTRSLLWRRHFPFLVDATEASVARCVAS